VSNCAKNKNNNETIEKNCKNLKLAFENVKSKMRVLTKEVSELKFKNNQAEKMILAFSLVNIIYEKVSKHYYGKSW